MSVSIHHHPTHVMALKSIVGIYTQNGRLARAMASLHIQSSFSNLVHSTLRLSEGTPDCRNVLVYENLSIMIGNVDHVVCD